MINLFNKPFNVLCQFTGGTANLSNYISLKGVYAAGRLDKDSEGLLLLTDDGALQHQVSHPKHKQAKIYWAQVEGVPNQKCLKQLQTGIRLKDGLTRPAKVKIIPEPDLWPRNPPIRYRASIATTWLEITLSEGRNRQVRRMTAAIGHPTLRLIRYAIGEWNLDSIKNGIQPGQWHKINPLPNQSPEQNSNTVKHASAEKPSPSNRRRHHRKSGQVSARRRT